MQSFQLRYWNCASAYSGIVPIIIDLCTFAPCTSVAIKQESICSSHATAACSVWSEQARSGYCEFSVLCTRVQSCRVAHLLLCRKQNWGTTSLLAEALVLSNIQQTHGSSMLWLFAPQHCKMAKMLCLPCTSAYLDTLWCKPATESGSHNTAQGLSTRALAATSLNAGREIQ